MAECSRAISAPTRCVPRRQIMSTSICAICGADLQPRRRGGSGAQGCRPLITLRCTTHLRRSPGIRDCPETPPSGVLGDWYAKIVATRPLHLVLCANERSLLCIVVPLAPRNRLQERFAAAARHRIGQIPAPRALVQAEAAALDDVRVGRATSRSVLATMNQFGYSVEAWLEAELLLTGAVAPGRRPFKFSENVIERALQLPKDRY